MSKAAHVYQIYIAATPMQVWAEITSRRTSVLPRDFLRGARLPVGHSGGHADAAAPSTDD